VEKHVEYFRKNGTLRSKPLRPPDDPLGVLARAKSQFSWIYAGQNGKEYRCSGLFGNQLCRLVDTVYRTEPDWEGTIVGGKERQPTWDAIVTEFRTLEVRWDVRGNQYAFKNGSTLPVVPPKYYRRFLGEEQIADGKTRIIVERRDERHVDVQVWWSGPLKSADRPGKPNA
jgi:hypothetical protein